MTVDVTHLCEECWVELLAKLTARSTQPTNEHIQYSIFDDIA